MEIMSKRLIVSGVCVLLGLLIALGCGKRKPQMEAGRGPAVGTITIDGKPLRGGTIFLVSAKDSMYRVAITIKSDGTFSVADAPTGDVLVAVDNESQKFNNPDNYTPIPKKYRDAKTSGLKATIGGGGAEGQKPLSIELKSK
jgi:hypothetical protein